MFGKVVEEEVGVESWFAYLAREGREAALNERLEKKDSAEERFLPQPNIVYCSQCGKEFHRYLRAVGFSCCEDHQE